MGAILVHAFDRMGITGLRKAVRRFAAQAGLHGQRLDDFVLAVNEIVTNAVMHGGGSGRLRLWRDNGAVCCEVSDQGPGLPAGRPTGQLPPTHQARGRGMWLASRLCDSVETATSPAGTTVLMRQR
jgi:serine/threonine-protein kinase RsbW